MMTKRLLLVPTLLLLAALIFPNARSLYEGIFFYLRDVIAYNPSAVQPINRTGRYASLYDLIRMRNSERHDYLLAHVNLPTALVTQIPISNSQLPNIFVRFSAQGPYTIYSAHYDKLHDDPEYQGASDNTAAVSVLLASVVELAARGDGGSRAFLFTGEEETGLRGAKSFYEYARANNIAIREIVNFDNLGRGRLAIRPSADIPGFVFTIPLVGDYVYDGRTLSPIGDHWFGLETTTGASVRRDLRRSAPYPPANARLTQALLRAQSDIVVYERFTAVSDSNVFQANGIDTVAISGDDMYYLEQTWHTYADRVELLDERNLESAYELIVRYAPR
jgi:Zn-dependent M28 family amino/carboxypeptidase